MPSRCIVVRGVRSPRCSAADAARASTSRRVASAVRYAVRHVARGQRPAGVLDVAGGIVEETIGARRLRGTAPCRVRREQRFVSRTPHVPHVRITLLCAGAERARDECGADRRCIRRERELDAMQRGEKSLNVRPRAVVRRVRARFRAKASMPCSRLMRSDSSPKITASPSKAMRTYPMRATPAGRGENRRAATSAATRAAPTRIRRQERCAPNRPVI